jgi:hypothetical protein
METSGQIHTPASTSEITPVSTGKEVGEAPQPVWTLWRREKALSLLGIELRFPVINPTIYSLY